jgi:hypothetical protein
LRLIARAKRLGLSLDDISDLGTLFDDRRCEPVQERLRALLAAKIVAAQDQVATLIAFTAQLQCCAPPSLGRATRCPSRAPSAARCTPVSPTGRTRCVM